MTAPIAVDEDAIDGMTDDCCNMVAATVQKVLGIPTGDVAAQNFHRRSIAWSEMREIVVAYLALEESHHVDD